MTTTINIPAGIAGNGKTTRMLRVYREFLRESAERLEIGRAVWLTPTHHSAAWVREQLLGDDLSACFNPNVLTFTGFAERVLQDSPEQMVSLSPLLQRTLVRRIIEHRQADGKLRYFSGIAATTGFIDQVVALISELKRGEIWPEHFEEAISTGTVKPRDRELAEIYSAYQQRLLDSNLYDSEGRFWSARDQLTRGHWGAFGDLSLVVVDGFSDFTTTQYEILKQLAQRAERMFVTLPLESPPRRADLFAKSQDSFRQLQSRVAVAVEHCEPLDDETTRPRALRWISENLFDNPREIVPAAEAEGIEILAMTGQLGEVQALAAAIKDLLLSGVHPSDIVVAFRSTNDYADVVSEVFTEAGIPFVCENRESLSSAAVIKAFMAVLHLEAENWSFRRLRSLLDSSYFDPQWPEYAEGTAVRDVSAQLRQFKLREERVAILERLERASRDDNSDEEISPERAKKRRGQRQSAGIATTLLSRLSETLEPLRRRQNMRAWAESLTRIARELRIDPRTLPRPTNERDARMYDRDTRIWQVFEKALFSITAVDEEFFPTTRTVGLKELLAEITDLLQGVKFPQHGKTIGKVRVFDAAQARNLEVPYLFVGGLTETGFPARRGDDCFYSEADRREFNDRGLSLQHRTSHTQDEMMLFYGVVTRARRKLILSYPAANTNGQPLLPSPYLLALQGLFEPGAIQLTHESSLDPIPLATRILTDADLRVVAMDEALNKRPALLRSLWNRPEGATLGNNLLAAVDAADQRFRTHGFTHYEGMIPGVRSRAILGERFSIEHQFSATELEAYASCPFRFFLKHVLKVQPLGSTEVETNQLRRGILVHEILTHLHQQFSAETTVCHLEPDALSTQFQELVKQRLTVHGNDPGLQQALDEIESRMLAEWGEEYGKQWTRYHKSVTKSWDVPLAPSKFEIAFGAAPGEDQSSADEQPHDCLVLGVAHRTVRVRGRIDRIDVGETAGQTVFSVVDYKTGKSARFRTKDVSEGHAIQLPLYALAVQRLGIVAPEAIPLQLGYWFVKETGYKNMLKTGKPTDQGVAVDEIWETRGETLEELVSQLAADIRQGCFPVYNSDPNCSANCPYHMACRVSQIRPLEESLHKTWAVGGRQ